MPSPISAPTALPISWASSWVRLLRCDLDLPFGVLGHRERVDHPHGVAVAEPLQLRDDLAVEVRVLKSQHDQLTGSIAMMMHLSAVPGVLGVPGRTPASRSGGRGTRTWRVNPAPWRPGPGSAGERRSAGKLGA